MATYFYIRVSTKEQNTIRQEIKAQEHDILAENVFIEKASGKNIKDRPVLNNLMAIFKPDDVLIVDSISRFARNTRDLLELIEELNQKSVTFISLKENIDTTTATGKFMLTIFGAVAELERGYIKERQAEGIAAVKGNKEKYKGRKPIDYPKGWEKYYKMYEEDIIKGTDMMKILGLKKTTFYKLLKKCKNEGI